MGKPFFEAFAKYCNENRKLVLKQGFAKWGSLPSYVWGAKLAELVNDLQKIGMKEIEGCGNLVFEKGFLKGSIEKQEFLPKQEEEFRYHLDILTQYVLLYLNDEQ